MAATTSQPTDATSTSDPKVAASTLDFLLIELVPLAHRIAADLHARDTALLSSSLERNTTLNTSTTAQSSTHPPAPTDKRQSLKSTEANTGGAPSTTTTTALTTTAPLGPDDDYDEDLQDSLQESILYRLDSLGYRFLYFPCGIIRGALAGFGLTVSVHAETTELPQAIFQIRTVGSKP
ncbi:hypothetical protein KCU65_g2657, partial [Aureobasidium melanogenum]